MSASERQQFGRYVLQERIAVGGMAEVFRATSESLAGFEKVLAIKRLHARHTEDENFVRMLLDEARIAATLHHSAIAQIYDVGVVGSNYYIAMEFVHGQSIYDLLKAVFAKDTFVPIAVAVHIVIEVLSALHHAHTRLDSSGQPLKIVHRDISPQNLLVSYDGDVKVVDFGIAKAALRSTETKSGVIKGKFYYMAPEQAQAGNVDHRCDEDDKAILLDKVKNATYTPPGVYRPGLPKKLEEIIARSMDANPEKRYQSADDMAWELTRFLKAAHLHPTRLHLKKYMSRMFGTTDGLFAPTVTSEAATDPKADSSGLHGPTVHDQSPPRKRAPARLGSTQILGDNEAITDPELHPATITHATSSSPVTAHDVRAEKNMDYKLKLVYGGVAILAIANLALLLLTRL
jgi:serine/threonine protein kinase